MIKTIFTTLLTLSFFVTNAQEKVIEEINLTLDNWHLAASEANYKSYFEALTDDSRFIGTDATECWNKKAFQNFAKPFFDRGKAWSFNSIQRHVYLYDNQKLAWFDELLTTQMKICRGSGVLELIDGHWKIKHYVLSMTIPNENTDEVTKIKASIEDALINAIREQK
jgi:hypothetical protein